MPKRIELYIAWAGLLGVPIMYLLPPKTPFLSMIALLAIYAFLAYPLCKLQQMEKSLWRRLLALALLAFLVCGFGYYVWPDKKEVLEKNIKLVENYPGEWPKTSTQFKRTMPLYGETLRNAFRKERDDYRLTPFVGNGNKAPLYEPRIRIELPINITVKPTKYWMPDVGSNSHIFTTTPFGTVTKGYAQGVNESLFLTFPKPGLYRINYLITGISGGTSISIPGNFNIELVEEK
jgi:hypothetical protein